MSGKRRQLYYFTPPTHALANLQNRQLKVSRFSKCNDPYELASFSLRDREIRQRHRDWLAWADKMFGLLCFCRDWTSPVLWGHYAMHHTGICLGFDVDARNFVDVRYTEDRLHQEITIENFFEKIDEDSMVDLFATKFSHWSYEDEVRLLINFDSPVDPNALCFHPFNADMRLNKVIVGPKSALTVSEVKNTIRDTSVEVFKARLAFQKYRVVRQENKSLW